MIDLLLDECRWASHALLSKVSVADAECNSCLFSVGTWCEVVCVGSMLLDTCTGACMGDILVDE